MSHTHALSFICTFNSLYFDILLLVLFWFSLSLSHALVCSMTPKHKSTSSQNPMHSGDLLSLTLHLILFGSMMMKPERTSRRTFHDEAFIWNAKSFFRIFSILTFPLSSTVGVGSPFVTSRSFVPPWSYRSFTQICTDLITLYLISPLVFEVHAL